MEKYRIQGGKKLFGEVEVSASKNSTLPILSACLLASDEVLINNFPKITDVENMLEMLRYLGSDVATVGNSLSIKSNNLIRYEIPLDLSKRVRSSIFLLGSILGKFKKAVLALPGGCNIGLRPIDLHIKGLKQLNVKIIEEQDRIVCDAKDIRGNQVFLDFPSVGATENIIMIAVLAKGETKIINAAKEPEIVDLANFLNTLGAKIYGAGTSIIRIEGVAKLRGGQYTPISDRIVAGTYLVAGALCGGDILLKNTDISTNYALKDILENFCEIECASDTLRLKSSSRPQSFSVLTEPYAGFPTDLQSQVLSLACVAKGESIICENIFETRFKNIDELVKMGANIQLNGKIASVFGVEKLHSADLVAYDLRGGAGLILAALKAEGTSSIGNIFHIERGYENIDLCFSKLGADIKRIEN